MNTAAMPAATPFGAAFAKSTSKVVPVQNGAKASEAGILDLVELILKGRDRVDVLIRIPALKAQLVPRFLAIALAGFVLFGIALALVFSAGRVWPRLTALPEVLQGAGANPIEFVVAADGATIFSPWLDRSAWTLIVAYAMGLIAASGICLPSLYFYGLLAGVRLTMLDVVLHTLKSKATAAVALVGILPIYAALALAIVIFPVPAAVRHLVFWLGLVLPFVAGLWGTWSLYCGFQLLADTMPSECRESRTCFLRRLVLAWAACYTAVTPVLIFTLWQHLS